MQDIYNVQCSNPIQQWLAYAPQVLELKPGKRWHIFLSYRSVNPDWAFQLYDALTRIGFSVFFDKFQIVAGTSLTSDLSLAISESESGVILWSNESRRSKWCKYEYESMHQMQIEDSNFHFVVIKMDFQPLPTYLKTLQYIDFSQSPEGPHGVGLLQIMYGLLNKPLSEEAVRFAHKIDMETTIELAKIDGARIRGDAASIILLGSSNTLAWLTSPLLFCQTAEALIALNEPKIALDVLATTEKLFLKSVRPKQLKARALSLCGRPIEAQAVVAELQAAGHRAGHRDPETLKLFAGTWTDLYKTSKARKHLEASRNHYAEVFEIIPTDYYTAIKLAATSLALGELDNSDKYVCQVEAIVGNQAVHSDYWKTATVAGIQLIRKNFPRAAQLYRTAIITAPEEKGSHIETLSLARFIMDHIEISPEEWLEIENAFISSK